MADERPDTGAGGYHCPVLLRQTLEALAVRPDGIYLDGTAGGGGHSAAIAERLTAGGRLIALDQDPDAIRAAGERLAGLPATLVQTNFVRMDAALSSLGIPAVDGILLDIGVSIVVIVNACNMEVPDLLELVANESEFPSSRGNVGCVLRRWLQSIGFPHGWVEIVAR